MVDFENPEWSGRYMDIMDKVRSGEWSHEQAEEVIQSDDIFGEPRILRVRVPTPEEYVEREAKQAEAKDFVENTRAHIAGLIESGELTPEEEVKMLEDAQKELDAIHNRKDAEDEADEDELPFEYIGSYEQLDNYNEEFNTAQDLAPFLDKMEIGGEFRLGIKEGDDDVYQGDFGKEIDEFFITVDDDDNSMFSTYMRAYKELNPDVPMPWLGSKYLDEPMECYYIFDVETNDGKSVSYAFQEFLETLGVKLTPMEK